MAKEECEEENSDGKVAEADKSDSDSDEEPTLSFTNPYNVSSGQPTTASTQLILYYTLGQIFVRPMGVFTGMSRPPMATTPLTPFTRQVPFETNFKLQFHTFYAEAMARFSGFHTTKPITTC